MPRPARSQWVPRTYARRRHRTWMWSMGLATLGWACWWIELFLVRFAPSIAPSPVVVAYLAGVPAVLGLVLALFAVRVTRSWLPFLLIALFANGGLIVLPWLARGLEIEFPG